MVKINIYYNTTDFKKWLQQESPPKFVAEKMYFSVCKNTTGIIADKRCYHTEHLFLKGNKTNQSLGLNSHQAKRDFLFYLIEKGYVSSSMYYKYPVPKIFP